MFRPNRLKQQLRDGKPSLGCWIVLNDPMVAEIVALAGFDFVVVDQEHGASDFRFLVSVCQALSGLETTAIVRVPWNDPVHIKRALDTGVEGVIVPMVDSAGEARDAVANCRYPPRGRRGTGFGYARAADYGLRRQYPAEIDDQLLIICQIETPTAADAAAEIAAVDGVDAVLIGPGDLSAGLGHIGQMTHLDVSAIVQEIETRIGSSAWMGTIPRGPLGATELFARGYGFVVGTSDVALLRDTARAYVAQAAGQAVRR